MYREDQTSRHTPQDQQESADPRVQARRALQAAYDWRDDEPAAEEPRQYPAGRRELAAAVPAASASWTSAV